MKKNDVYKLIDMEITWCKVPSNRTMPEEYMQGFVDGMKQVKLLVKRARLK